MSSKSLKVSDQSADAQRPRLSPKTRTTINEKHASGPEAPRQRQSSATKPTNPKTVYSSELTTIIEHEKPTGNPDSDWKFWFKPNINTDGHHVFESETELLEKQTTVREIIASAPKMPQRLDTARLKNVLFELSIHFRVARLLPSLLLCKDGQKLESLGENVNRSLQLLKLQLRLCPHSLRLEENNDRSAYTNKSGLSDEEKIERENYVQNRLTAPHSQPIFSVAESFSTLCSSFRDNFEYRLLKVAEKLFIDELEENRSFPIVDRLKELIASIMHIILDGLHTTPYDARETSDLIKTMNAASSTAENTKKLLQQDYDGTLAIHKAEYEELAEKITKDENIISRRLQQLQEARASALNKIRRQLADDLGPHRHKVARMQAEIMEHRGFLLQQNKQSHTDQRAFIKHCELTRKYHHEVEISVLQKCVELKTEILSLQDREEILDAYLHVARTEERESGEEMNFLVRDREERDEKRRQMEAEIKRKNDAAVMIQKTWRGFITRQKLKKKRKKGKKKKKKKGKSKGGKSSPKPTKQKPPKKDAVKTKK